MLKYLRPREPLKLNFVVEFSLEIFNAPFFPVHVSHLRIMVRVGGKHLDC